MPATLRELETEEDLENALRESYERPVVIFKHSVTCPISAHAFQEFKSHLEGARSTVSYNLITVQTARRICEFAAARLGVRHESPQAIIVTQCRPTWNASHSDITAEALNQAVNEVSH